MAITSVSVIMTVIVLNLHYRGPITKEIPDWIKKRLIKKPRVVERKYSTLPYLFSELSPMNVPQFGTRENTEEEDENSEEKSKSDPAMMEMLKILQNLVRRQNLEDEHNRAVHDWRLLALAVDRVLFWIILVITVISSVSFLVIIPIQKRGFGF